MPELGVDVVVERREPRGREAAHVLVERVHEEPERHVALELRRAAREHQHAAGVGHAAQLGEQAGLPDARLADQRDRRGLRPGGAIQRGAQHGQLRAPSDQF